jgi:hypothetical protein
MGTDWLRGRIAGAIVLLAILAAGGVLAHMHVAAQVYHPVVRMTSPNGLVFTAVHEETAGRRECGEANRTFITPFRAKCPRCETVFARCARTLEGVPALVDQRQPIPDFLVISPGMRLVIAGPEAQARDACNFVAADMVTRGFSTAVCIAPVTGKVHGS